MAKKIFVINLILLSFASCSPAPASLDSPKKKSDDVVCTTDPRLALCGVFDLTLNTCQIEQDLLGKVIHWPVCSNWGRILNLRELVALRVCMIQSNRYKEIMGPEILQKYCAINVPKHPLYPAYVHQQTINYAAVRATSNNLWYIVQVNKYSPASGLLPRVELCCNPKIDATQVFILPDAAGQDMMFPRTMNNDGSLYNSIENQCISDSEYRSVTEITDRINEYPIIWTSLDFRVFESDEGQKIWNINPSWHTFSDTSPVKGLQSVGTAGLILLESMDRSIGFSLTLTGDDRWLADPFIFFEGSPVTATILVGVNQDFQLAAVTFATNITELVAWQPVFEKIPYPDELTLVPASIEPESPLPPLATLPLTNYTWYVSQCTLE